MGTVRSERNRKPGRACGSQENRESPQDAAMSPWELGPQPNTKSGTQDVWSRIRNRESHMVVPASLSAVWQTFHPPSSPERRRCYTSRTPSVWSAPRSLPMPDSAGRLKGLSPLLGPPSISFVSVAFTSILLCCVCSFVFLSFDQFSLVRMPADSLESVAIP